MSRDKQELLLSVYQHLRTIAHGRMARERADHSFQGTDLLHQALFKLIGNGWLEAARDEQHLIALTVTAMRQELLDYAKARKTAKRDPGGHREPLDPWADQLEAGAGTDTLVLLEWCDEIDVALSERHGRVALLWLQGFTEAEIASLLEEPAATIAADVKAVRGFLKKRLARGGQP